MERRASQRAEEQIAWMPHDARRLLMATMLHGLLRTVFEQRQQGFQARHLERRSGLHGYEHAIV